MEAYVCIVSSLNSKQMNRFFKIDLAKHPKHVVKMSPSVFELFQRMLHLYRKQVATERHKVEEVDKQDGPFFFPTVITPIYSEEKSELDVVTMEDCLENLNSIQKRCTFCSARSDTLVYCSICKIKGYCSKECLAKHERKDHKVEHPDSLTTATAPATIPPSNDTNIPPTNNNNMNNNNQEQQQKSGSSRAEKKKQRKKNKKTQNKSTTSTDVNVEQPIPESLDDTNEKLEQQPQPQENACANCGTKEGKLWKCSICKAVYYCSVDCQKQDWDNHKITH
jgi:hypothetical protein